MKRRDENRFEKYIHRYQEWDSIFWLIGCYFMTDWLIDWLIDWLTVRRSWIGPGRRRRWRNCRSLNSSVNSLLSSRSRSEGSSTRGGGGEGLSWKKKLDVGPHYLEKHYKYNIKVLLHFQICTWQSRRHWSVGGFTFLKVCIVVQKKFWNYLLSKSVTNLEIKKNILKRKD